MLAAVCALDDRQREGCFELSVGNPDKGLLPVEVVRQRIRQFTEAKLPLVITQVLSGPMCAGSMWL